MSAPATKKLTANQGVRKRDVLMANFIGGIAWGLGSVIGATIIVAILVWGLNLLGLFDYFKDYFPETSYNKVKMQKVVPSQSP
jgi:hypothetical protein